MGCDVHGFVEVNTRANPNGEKWVGVVNIEHVLHRGYDSFGSLFGVKNRSGFTPYAAKRGLPSGLSTEAQALYEEWEVDAHGMSYLTLEEVLYDIPWDEPSYEGSERTRWSVLGEQWAWLLGEVMPWLGLRWGREDVRLVVWFEG